MRNLWYESTMHRQIRDKRSDRKRRIGKDIDRYGKDVLASDELKQAFEQTHHTWSTVGEHTLRVAASSVMISYALRKLNIKVNIPAVIIGALCHDLGMLGRSEKYATSKDSVREHPKDSAEKAKEIVEELPEKAADIIERHMWPLGDSKAPNSIEGAVVSIADKYVAVKDIVKGSELKDDASEITEKESEEE